MRLLLALWLALVPAWPALAAGTPRRVAVAPLPVQVKLGALVVAPLPESAALAHLAPLVARPGALGYRPISSYGHYDFDTGRAALSMELAAIPLEHAAPAAAHELHHKHEHEAGLLSRETFGGELRAHEVQAQATKIAMKLGWLTGETLEVKSPTLDATVPVVVPYSLADAARRVLAKQRIAPEDAYLVAYYRGLSTTLTAHEMGRLDEIIRRFYPHLN